MHKLPTGNESSWKLKPETASTESVGIDECVPKWEKHENFTVLLCMKIIIKIPNLINYARRIIKKQ